MFYLRFTQEHTYTYEGSTEATQRDQQRTKPIQLWLVKTLVSGRERLVTVQHICS